MARRKRAAARDGISSALESVAGRQAASAVGYAFECMEVAEQEIAEAKRRHPARAGALHQAFGILMPPIALRMLGEEAYRAHVRELLEAVAAGEDTRLGTSVEVMAALMAASLKAPLESNAQALYEALFEQAYPAEAAKIFAAGRARERWSGAVRELHADMRRRLSVPERRIAVVAKAGGDT